MGQPSLAPKVTFCPSVLGSAVMGLLEWASGLCPPLPGSQPVGPRPAASCWQQALISCCWEAEAAVRGAGLC